MSWVWQAAGGGGGGGPPIPASGRRWGVIYRVDFTAQPTVASYVPGAHVIDGKQWFLQGTLVQGGGVVQSADLLSGAGLRTTTNFSSEGTDSATNLRWVMALDQLPRFNSQAQVAIWSRSDISIPGSQLSNAIIGFANMTKSSASMTLAQRQTRIGFSLNASAGASNLTYWAHNTTGNSGQSTGVLGPSNTLFYGVQATATDGGVYATVVNTGAAPDPYLDAANIPSAAHRFQVTPSPRVNSQLGVYLATNFNGGATCTFGWRELIVMQPIN